MYNFQCTMYNVQCTIRRGEVLIVLINFNYGGLHTLLTLQSEAADYKLYKPHERQSSIFKDHAEEIFQFRAPDRKYTFA